MVSKVKEPSITSEIKLLMLCARTSIGNSQKEQVRSLAKNGFDWDELVRLAKKHGVTSLLYWNLNAICPDLVPSDVLLFLRQHFQANAARAQLLTQELIQVAKTAATSGVSLIPFKGPTLAAMAYGNLFLRDFRDMDLIVAREAIPKAYEVFEDQGYHTLDAQTKPYSKDLCFKRYHHFVKAHGTVRVDLQWVMARGDFSIQFDQQSIQWGLAEGDFSFQLDRQSILKNLQPIQLHDEEVMSLAPEELLLILCVHGSKHVWEELKWVCDVAELVRSHQDIDWERVLVLAREWRCRRMLFLGLSLAHRLFDIALPEILKQQITSDLVVATLVQNIRRSLFDPIHSIDERDYHAYYFCLKDRWCDRWCYGVYLCRMDSPVVTKTLPWFQAQSSLLRLNRVLQPMQIVVRKLKELFNLKRTVAAWLEGVSG